MNPLTMFPCTFRHDTTLQQHRLLSVTANVTEPSGERTSENLHNSNFVELSKSEVQLRRILLLRGWVNKSLCYAQAAGRVAFASAHSRA
jgi:hypothetical protein